MQAMLHFSLVRSALAGLLSLSILASCSEPQGGDDVGFSVDPPVTFSEREKAAAQKLSIGSNSGLSEASGPYDQAVLCRSAIGALRGQFRETGDINSTQMRAIEQAVSIFDQRLQVLGSREGKSASQIARDVEQKSEIATDISTQAQLAVTCLQRLQS